MIEISSIGVATAIASGSISFLSPCVLPLVPGYVSYIAGNSIGSAAAAFAIRARLTAVALSLCFVLGFSTVFVALGASATSMSRLLSVYRSEANLVGGGVIIIFGLFSMGLMRPRWLERDVRFHGQLRGGRPLGAYVLGLAFGFGWTPCIGPILGAILTVSAVSETAFDGAALLAFYSLGLGLPFLAATLFTEELVRCLKPMRRVGRSLQVGAGVVMVVMGLAMITGKLAVFAFWILEQFPFLARIG